MRLTDLIRNRVNAGIATAIPATFATFPTSDTSTVARIATVAVANPAEAKTKTPKVGADEAATSQWWRLHFVDREPMEVSIVPPATADEVRRWYPQASEVIPFEPPVVSPERPLNAEEETAIRAWLALIEETDPAAIAGVLQQCQRDVGARDYFLGRARAELPATR